MRKILVIVLVLSVIASSGVISCAPKEAAEVPQEELLPCELKLIEVTTVFAGKESITFAPALSVSNPNSVQVALTLPFYQFFADGQLVEGKQFLDKVYIPAKTEVRLTHAFTAIQPNLVGRVLIGKGGSPGQAMMSVLPLWKTMGGVLPVDALKDQWDAIPTKACLFEAGGRVRLSSQLGALEMPFRLEWQK